MAISVEEFSQRRPYNAVSDFVDANVARGLGDKLAFSDGARTLTYAELQGATCRCAEGLRALGLRQERHRRIDTLAAAGHRERRRIRAGVEVEFGIPDK